MVRVGVPVRPHGRPVLGVVLVAGDDERGRGHRGEVHGAEHRHPVGREPVEGVAAPAGRADQHALRDPRVEEVDLFVRVGVGDPGAEEEFGGEAAQRVPGHRDLAAVDAPGELRHGLLDLVEPVDDVAHVLRARAPEEGSSGHFGDLVAQPGGAQVVGLDHDEAAGRPDLGEGEVAVERGQAVRPAMAVRQEDDRQVGPGQRCGDADLEVQGASGHGQREGADRQHGRGGGVQVGVGYGSPLRHGACSLRRCAAHRPVRGMKAVRGSGSAKLGPKRNLAPFHNTERRSVLQTERHSASAAYGRTVW